MKLPTISAGRLAGLPLRSYGFIVVSLAWLLILTGCKTTDEFQSVEPGSRPGELGQITLKNGDLIKIDFPDSPNLTTSKKIADGKVDLYPVGEVMAAGKTVPQLHAELVERYKTQLVTAPKFNITIEYAPFSVLISGAVLRPGEITSNQPITAAEALLKVGVDFTRAGLSKVKVTRDVGGRYENYTIDLDRVLHGRADTKPFYLKPGDSLFVPEKFQWF